MQRVDHGSIRRKRHPHQSDASGHGTRLSSGVPPHETIMSSKRNRTPAITVCRSDYDQLTSLADASFPRHPAVSELLLGELDRARIVDDVNLRPDIARIGSTLDYSTDQGYALSVTLVLPKYADISRGFVSILTPIGVALLGLSPGQSIDWLTTNGARHTLTIARVSQASLPGSASFSGS
jgi:regulator of nucleoside diphosphate kinase